MKVQTLFTLAALGSGTLAAPAWPMRPHSKPGDKPTPSFPTMTSEWPMPTDAWPTGTGAPFPTGWAMEKRHGKHSYHPKPTGAFPTGGYPSPTDGDSFPTLHAILPTDKRHGKHSHHHKPTGAYPTGGFPMPTGYLPKILPRREGGPVVGARHRFAPYPRDGAEADAHKSHKSHKSHHSGGHKTGHGHATGHSTGGIPKPTGIMPTGYTRA